MNRKERRAAEATARRAEVEPRTAYHEAGHAIGRLLTSVVMGYEPEEAVDRIEINPGASGVSSDGRMQLSSQAVCMGPMVSKQFETEVRATAKINGSTSLRALWDAFAAHGSDDERSISMRSRMLIDVMGAAAETRYLGKKDATALFANYACEADREDFARSCKAMGLPAADVDGLKAQFLAHAQSLVERPLVWEAIEAVGKRLKSTMPGVQVSELAWPVLSKDVEAFEAVLPEDRLRASRGAPTHPDGSCGERSTDN